MSSGPASAIPSSGPVDGEQSRFNCPAFIFTSMALAKLGATHRTHRGASMVRVQLCQVLATADGAGRDSQPEYEERLCTAEPAMERGAGQHGLTEFFSLG